MWLSKLNNRDSFESILKDVAASFRSHGKSMQFYTFFNISSLGIKTHYYHLYTFLKKA